MFTKRVFNVSDVPTLDLSGETRVDIGYLSGDAHRDAFAALFLKMLADNAEIGVAVLEAVSNSRGHPLRLRAALPAPFRSLDLSGLARDLYSCGEEKVFLHVATRTGHLRVGVSFDDPEFWISERTA